MTFKAIRGHVFDSESLVPLKCLSHNYEKNEGVNECMNDK